MLEQIVLQQIEQLNARIIVLRGLPEQAINITSKHTILSHLPGEELKKILINSEYVIARSGYTSIMELLSLQKKCFLIPTPGQTEQEYLAKRLTDMKICFSIQQHKLDFIKQLPGLAQFPFCSFHSEVFSVEKFHSLLENM
jgi:predicted glycosyltransferase